MHAVTLICSNFIDYHIIIAKEAYPKKKITVNHMQHLELSS